MSESIRLTGFVSSEARRGEATEQQFPFSCIVLRSNLRLFDTPLIGERALLFLKRHQEQQQRWELTGRMSADWKLHRTSTASALNRHCWDCEGVILVTRSKVPAMSGREGWMKQVETTIGDIGKQNRGNEVSLPDIINQC